MIFFNKNSKILLLKIVLNLLKNTLKSFKIVDQKLKEEIDFY